MRGREKENEKYTREKKKKIPALAIFFLWAIGSAAAADDDELDLVFTLPLRNPLNDRRRKKVFAGFGDSMRSV